MGEVLDQESKIRRDGSSDHQESEQADPESPAFLTEHRAALSRASLLDIIDEAERLGQFENTSLDEPVLKEIHKVLRTQYGADAAGQVAELQRLIERYQKHEGDRAQEDRPSPLDNHFLSAVLEDPNQLNRILDDGTIDDLARILAVNRRANDFRNSLHELAGDYVYPPNHPLTQAPRSIQDQLRADQSQLRQLVDRRQTSKLDHYLRDRDLSDLKNLSAIETTALFYRLYDLHQYARARDVFRDSHNPLFHQAPETREQYIKALVHTDDHRAALTEIAALIRDQYLDGDLCEELAKIFQAKITELNQTILAAHEASQIPDQSGMAWQIKKEQAFQELERWRQLTLDVLRQGFQVEFSPADGTALISALLEEALRNREQRPELIKQVLGVAELVEIAGRKNATQWLGDYRLIVKYVTNLCFLTKENSETDINGLVDLLTKQLTKTNWEHRLEFALRKNLEPLQKSLAYFDLQEFPELGRANEQVELLIGRLHQEQARRKLEGTTQTTRENTDDQAYSEWLNEDDPTRLKTKRDQRLTRDIFEMGFMYGQLSTHIEGNYKYDGNHHAHTINRWDIEVAREILRHPSLQLTETTDVEEFNRVIDAFLRERYQTAQLEDITSPDHQEFDAFMEHLNQLLDVRKEDDGRTNVLVDFFLGRGDCRQHAYTKQLFFEVWKDEQMQRLFAKSYQQLELSTNPNLTAFERQQAETTYQELTGQLSNLANRYMLVFDSEIRAPIAIEATYEVLTKDGQPQLTSRADHQERARRQHAEWRELQTRLSELKMRQAESRDPDEQRQVTREIFNLQQELRRGRYFLSEQAWPPVFDNHTWNGYVTIGSTGIVQEFRMVDAFYQDGRLRLGGTDPVTKSPAGPIVNIRELDHHLPMPDSFGPQPTDGKGLRTSLHFVTDRNGRPIEHSFQAGTIKARAETGELLDVPVIISPAGYSGSRSKRRGETNDMAGQPWLRGYLLSETPKRADGKPDVSIFFDPSAIETIRAWGTRIASQPVTTNSEIQTDQDELV